MRSFTTVGIITIGLALDSGAAAADEGKLSVGFRYRLEDVGDEAFAKDARASTLRTTLGYRTPSWRGLEAFVEFENVTDLGLDDDHANGGAGSLSNGVTDRPIINDPEITQVNQAYVRLTRIPKTTVDVGRQAFALADERHVGPVGWRQNHQCFDAMRVVQKSIPRTTIDYAFLRNVNRISGENKGMASHLLGVTVDAGKGGTVTPYLHRLDYDDLSDAGLSTDTLGIRWEGGAPIGETWTLKYLLEGARQSDTGDNPGAVDADYLRAEIGGASARYWLKAGWETLGATAGEGRFTTPLATLHKFNGWADKFLATPADGLRDLYLGVGGASGAFAWTVVVHDFTADIGGADYGTEWDAEVSWRASWKQLFALKAAVYREDGFAQDTEKLWFYTTWGF